MSQVRAASSSMKREIRGQSVVTQFPTFRISFERMSDNYIHTVLCAVKEKNSLSLIYHEKINNKKNPTYRNIRKQNKEKQCFQPAISEHTHKISHTSYEITYASAFFFFQCLFTYSMEVFPLFALSIMIYNCVFFFSPV